MAIEPARVGLILLAAGRARRFGADKLAQNLDGRPLAHHAAATLAGIAFGHAVAVVGANDLGLARFGFGLCRVAPGLPLSASIVCGVSALADADCDACLIALADMPRVPEAHFRALMATHAHDSTATSCGGRATVPAMFARSMFASLATLTGDRGAAALLAGASCTIADPTWMIDVDTPADLARLQGAESLILRL